MTEEEKDHQTCGLCGSDICCTLPVLPEETQEGDVCPQCGRRHSPVMEKPTAVLENAVCSVCGTEVCCDVAELAKEEAACPDCGNPLLEIKVMAP